MTETNNDTDGIFIQMENLQLLLPPDNIKVVRSMIGSQMVL